MFDSRYKDTQLKSTFSVVICMLEGVCITTNHYEGVNQWHPSTLLQWHWVFLSIQAHCLFTCTEYVPARKQIPLLLLQATLLAALVTSVRLPGLSLFCCFMVWLAAGTMDQMEPMLITVWNVNVSVTPTALSHQAVCITAVWTRHDLH